MKDNTSKALVLWGSVSLTLLLFGIIEGRGLAAGVLVGTPLFLLSVLWLRRVRGSHEMELVAVFALAVALRWASAAAIHLLIYTKQPGLLSPDELDYDFYSRFIAEYWLGRLPALPPGTPKNGVTYVAASCHMLFGYVPLMPKLLNGLAGGWNAVLTALIGAHFVSRKAARRAGYLFAVFPSLVLWASLLIKDNWALLGVETSFYMFLLLRQRVRLSTALLFVAALMQITAFRPYELVFVGIGVGATFLFSSTRHLLRNALLFAAVGFAFMVLIRSSGAILIGTRENQSAVDQINEIRSAYTNAGSAVDIGLVDTSTPLGMILWTPVGLLYFFLAPIPFTGGSAISLGATPEMLAWYWMLPSLWRGGRELLRRDLRRIAPFVFYACMSAAGWSLVVANVGSLFRYRAQVMFVPLILIAYDQIVRAEQKARKRHDGLYPHIRALRPFRPAEIALQRAPATSSSDE